ncbi:disulfide bond formation protein B [Candidatus Pacearchaeota archaeon]|nr:disulfide bond formation protein B [Candidatus Pacearchaeota archaeon]
MALEIFFNKLIGIGTLVIHIILGLALIIFIYAKINKKKLPDFVHDSNKFLSENGIALSFLIALGASIGSLVYSEIIGLPPCDLCWYQRALIYPQVIILGVALLKKNNEIFDYVLGLNIIGILIGGYQYVMQMINFSGPCPVSGGIDCFTRDVIEFGYITIPLMSITVFVIIIVLTFMAKNKHLERFQKGTELNSSKVSKNEKHVEFS